MIKHYLLPSLPLVAAFLLAGCIDNNYDLSDLDTSVKVDVNDLTVPVNIGGITLNSLIDVEDSENISKEIYDGKEIFVFHSEGDFGSDDIHINSFSVNPPKDINPSTVKVNLLKDAMGNRKPRREGVEEFVYHMGEREMDFTYHINDIDKKVTSVQDIETPKMTLTTEIEIPESFRNDMQSITIEDLKIQFPAGLKIKNNTPATANIGTYDDETGILYIKETEIVGDKLSLTITAQNIDMQNAGLTIKNGNLDYTGHINIIEGGQIIMVPKPGIIPPETFTMRTDYELSSFDIETFTGRIDYGIEDLSFDDVNLNDLPDFLSQDDTKINIANPQIYISIYNTCADYDLEGETGFSVTPKRPGETDKTLELPELIKVGYKIDGKKSEGPYKFAISPEGKNLELYGDLAEEYKNAEKLSFPNLGEVLYGNGLPKQIGVEFINPKVDGEANKFPLKMNGVPESQWNIPGIHGEYKFRAPLALTNGSKIMYSGTETDWDSEALEDLHIEYLIITATASSTIPMDVDLGATLIDKDGNHIGKCEATKVLAETDNQEIEIKIEASKAGEYLTGINGVNYNAAIIAPEKDYQNPSDVPVLSPEQTITLTNVRAKINGFYQHLDKND